MLSIPNSPWLRHLFGHLKTLHYFVNYHTTALSIWSAKVLLTGSVSSSHSCLSDSLQSKRTLSSALKAKLDQGSMDRPWTWLATVIEGKGTCNDLL